MADGRQNKLTWIPGAALAAVLAVMPVSMIGCESTGSDTTETRDDGTLIETVTLGGEKIALELALDNATRTLGMGGRDFIAPDEGMLFVFKDPRMQSFVMRDCPIPIDILYLSRTGRIVRMYTMEPEPPQGPEESDMAYESRLKRYPSGTLSQFVIELAGGRAGELGLQVGQTIDLDIERLKGMAR
jgi:uncharacterized membrane protein (UPF0127 family)